MDEPDLPHVHWGACSSRYRLMDNRRLSGPVESINVNVGDPSDDVKESGSSELKTAPKPSEASAGS
jgi:hypothetical protein